MTGKCTYLPLYDVLPAKSLLYSEFCVLNELNNVKVNGFSFDAEQKRRIINELFKRNGSVTKKQLVDWLIADGSFGNVTKNDVSGMANESKFLANMSSYNSLSKIFGDMDGQYKLGEDIIYWSTVFGGEKDILVEKISQAYPDVTKEELKRVKGLTFSGWGRMSAQFLGEPDEDGVFLDGTNRRTGERCTILELLYESPMNLQSILNHSDWNFQEELDKINDPSFDNSFSYENLVADLSCSPSVKRQLWTVLRVVKEITDYMGCAPDKTYVEMARQHKKKEKGTTPVTKAQNLFISLRSIRSSSNLLRYL